MKYEPKLFDSEMAAADYARELSLVNADARLGVSATGLPLHTHIVEEFNNLIHKNGYYEDGRWRDASTASWPRIFRRQSSAESLGSARAAKIHESRA